MSKESYIRGFCKAAEAAGVDPKALAKYAADNNAGKTGKSVAKWNEYGPEMWVGNSAVTNNTGIYHVPRNFPSPEGAYAWLKKTTPTYLHNIGKKSKNIFDPESVDVVPGGAASVTNSPDAVFYRLTPPTAESGDPSVSTNKIWRTVVNPRTKGNVQVPADEKALRLLNHFANSY